ncbi:MAG: hypothetical protein KIS73_05265 [Enhydrobacter sp.]|nr:hypothetical protein [Enhydrobacter sp.]
MIRLPALLVTFLAVPLYFVRAAGTAHVVDDFEVETPGTCRLARTLDNGVPAWRRLRQRRARLHGTQNAVAGDGYGLRPLSVSVGCAAVRAVDKSELSLGGHDESRARARPQRGGELKSCEFALDQILALVTVRFNFQYRWSYLDSVHNPHAASCGVQFEATFFSDFVLMVEAFGRNPRVTGSRIGLCYTPGQGASDFDLLVGALLDPVGTRSATIGVTLRF